jgi:hypothetical protein
MPQHLRDIVIFRSDRLFNGAVNIGWFGSDEARTLAAASAFVFHGPEYHGVAQADVGFAHGHRLQDTANFARSIVLRCYGVEDQPFTLAIAGYGTGKSHLGLALAALLSCPEGRAAQTVLGDLDTADPAIGSEVRAVLRQAAQPCLVVALNGMQSFDLTTEVTRQIVRQVKASGLDTRCLDELRPRFSQAASLVRMAETNRDVVGELVTACDGVEVDAVLARLEAQDELVYQRVHAVFAARGIPITALGGESVRDIIDVTVREYCGTGRPYRSLVVLFDEFGRYTEFATVRSQVAGSGVLQDLFEAIQANGSGACFAGFIQFELNAYVQRVAPEYRNDILRYVTRYQAANRVYLSINLETLVASLLEKRRPRDLDRWFDGAVSLAESATIAANLARWFPQCRNHRLWREPQQFHRVIRKGCWPLSAFSTWFLFHLAAAGKHLQERSALALLGDAFERYQDAVIADDGTWCLAPVDLWSEALQQELIVSEEGGQQGSITHAYTSVFARHGAGLNDDLNRLLRAAVLASKMGLQASDRDDAVEALSVLAGLPLNGAESGLRLLQDEYNVLEWDESFREFDVLGDAVPRTQFLSFVRQRVASTYDEGGKATLFASKAATWCDLLSDVDCDFAEENKITTREWRYQGVTSSLDVLPMQVKLAADRWAGAIGVDEPRGTVIYCYVEPSRDAAIVAADAGRLLRTAAGTADVAAQPVLIVLLCDEDGTLGQALAELAVLEESVGAEDRVRYGNLIAAHQDKMRQVARSRVESMIKERRYITALREALAAPRLSSAGTELFSRIYRSPLTFPFDGFSTARGNAADSCQDLVSELLLGRLDYDSVMGKPVRVKNRAIAVLKESWGIFAQNGNVKTRPSQPVIRSLTEKWDGVLATGDRRLAVEAVVRQACAPPYGGNIASAALALGVFVAPRMQRLTVVRDGQQISVSQWVHDGIFRGKFVDMAVLHGVELVHLGAESSEWDVLLEEWEQAESYSARSACLERASELKVRVPVPPALAYREVHLVEQGQAALQAIAEMHQQQNDALTKVETGYGRVDVALMSWGAATLSELVCQMTVARPLWTDDEIAFLGPHVERARQAVIQCFPEWLARQVPRDGTPDAVGDFKHRMVRLNGGNLKKLGLDDLSRQLELHTNEKVRNFEAHAAAQQLVRDAHSWLTAHGDPTRIVRVAELRDLRDAASRIAAKLQTMSDRIQNPDMAPARIQLMEACVKMKEAEERIADRAARVWQAKLRSQEDIESILGEVNALMGCYEGCPRDLEDFQKMPHALRLYQGIYRQLADERLSWGEYESLEPALVSEAEGELGDQEVPWPPAEVVAGFVTSITGRRRDASAAWIESVEAAAGSVRSMSAVDANRLYTRASNPPAILTEPHRVRLSKTLDEIASRLGVLKVEWLVEKFRELEPPLRSRFLGIVSGEPG